MKFNQYIKSSVQRSSFLIMLLLCCSITSLVALSTESPREQRRQEEKTNIEKNRLEIEKKRQEIEILEKKSKKDSEDILKEQKESKMLNELIEKQIKAREEFGKEFTEEQHESKAIVEELKKEYAKIEEKIAVLSQELKNAGISIDQQGDVTKEINVPLSTSKRLGKKLEAFWKEVQAKGYELFNNKAKAAKIRQNLIDIYTLLDADPKTILTNVDLLRRSLSDKNAQLKNDVFALNLYLQEVTKIDNALKSAPNDDAKKAILERKKQADLDILRKFAFPATFELVEIVQYIKEHENEYTDLSSKELIKQITDKSEVVLKDLINDEKPWNYLRTPEEKLQAEQEAAFANRNFKSQQFSIFQERLHKLVGKNPNEGPLATNFILTINGSDYAIIKNDLKRLEDWYYASTDPNEKLWIANVLRDSYAKILEGIKGAQAVALVKNNTGAAAGSVAVDISIEVKKSFFEQEIQKAQIRVEEEKQPAVKKIIDENQDAVINKNELVNKADALLSTREQLLTLLADQKAINVDQAEKLYTLLNEQTTNFVNLIEQSDPSQAAIGILEILTLGFIDIVKATQNYVALQGGWEALRPEVADIIIKIYLDATNKINELGHQQDVLKSDLTVVVNGQLKTLSQITKSNALEQKNVTNVNQEFKEALNQIRENAAKISPRKIIYNPRDKSVWQTIIFTPERKESTELQQEEGSGGYD